MDKFSTDYFPVDVMGRNLVDTINGLKDETIHICSEDRWYQSARLLLGAEILPYYYSISFITEDHQEAVLPINDVHYLEIPHAATEKLIGNQHDLSTSFSYSYPSHPKTSIDSNDELMYLLNAIQGMKLDILSDQGIFRNVQLLASDYSYVILQNFTGRHFFLPLYRIKKITDFV